MTTRSLTEKDINGVFKLLPEKKMAIAPIVTSGKKDLSPATESSVYDLVESIKGLFKVPESIMYETSSMAFVKPYLTITAVAIVISAACFIALSAGFVDPNVFSGGAKTLMVDGVHYGTIHFPVVNVVSV
jgi:hypothetical protein